MHDRTVMFCVQSSTPVGGVETWLDHICDALGSNGWRPIVGLVRGAKSHDPTAWRAAHPELEVVEIDGRGMPTEGRVRAILRVIRRVKPDVVVPLSVVNGYDAIARLKQSGSGVRHLMSVHGNTPHLIADLCRYGRFADMLVCPGALTCRLGQELAGVPHERIRHVPNGALRASVKRVARSAGEAIRLGYVGRFSRNDKRAFDLIPFCRELEEAGTRFTMEIVGYGGERETLERGLGDYVDRGMVRFHGRLTRDELYRRIYPQLDALMLFSESEAFGIVLVEAMMHGVVPVTSRYVGHAAERLVKGEETGLLFDIGDMRQAAACVARLDGDHVLWGKLSESGRSKAERAYDWSQSMKKWVAAFENVLALQPVPVKNSERAVKPIGQRGRLDRWGVPPGIVDLIRRLRRGTFGVPSSMVGGEEWPLTNSHYSAEELEAIRIATVELDVASRSISDSALSNAELMELGRA